jgi:hypothetical protein
VKFIKVERGIFSFQIAGREREMLFHVLGLYPLIPVAHQQLSKSEDRPADQQLLEETLAAQRKRNRQQIQTLLKSKTSFREEGNGYCLSLKAAQMEWVLQVLNDVRVGSWLILGSPDGPAETFAVLNEKTAPYFWAMEVAGDFQMALIKAMGGE